MTYHKGRLLSDIVKVLMGLIFICFFLPLIAHLQGEDVGTLIQKLKDEDPRVQMGAADALVRIGKPAVESLIIALKDEGSNVRWETAMALVRIGKPAVEPLIVVLKDKNLEPGAREMAARALGRIGDSQAIEPLIVALKDKDRSVQMRAVFALVKIGKPAVEPLIVALGDKNDDVRMRVAWALEKITGENFGEDHLRWQEWWEKNKRNFSK